MIRDFHEGELKIFTDIMQQFRQHSQLPKEPDVVIALFIKIIEKHEFDPLNNELKESALELLCRCYLLNPQKEILSIVKSSFGSDMFSQAISNQILKGHFLTEQELFIGVQAPQSLKRCEGIGVDPELIRKACMGRILKQIPTWLTEVKQEKKQNAKIFGMLMGEKTSSKARHSLENFKKVGHLFTHIPSNGWGRMTDKEMTWFLNQLNRENVVELDLTDSRLENLRILSDFESLKKLVLRNNQQIGIDAFGTFFCPRVEELDVSHCPHLKTIFFLKNMPNLKVLKIEGAHSIDDRAIFRELKRPLTIHCQGADRSTVEYLREGEELARVRKEIPPHRIIT